MTGLKLVLLLLEPVSSSIETDDLLVAFEDEKASLGTIREAAENENKAELPRSEEEAKNNQE